MVAVINLKVIEDIQTPPLTLAPQWLEGSSAARKYLLPLHRVPTWETPTVSSRERLNLGRCKTKPLDWNWKSPAIEQLCVWVGTSRTGRHAQQKHKQRWHHKPQSRRWREYR